jgi:hypothetical protein
MPPQPWYCLLRRQIPGALSDEWYKYSHVLTSFADLLTIDASQNIYVTKSPKKSKALLKQASDNHY